MDWLVYSLISMLGSCCFVGISKHLTNRIPIVNFIFYLFAIETVLFGIVSDKKQLLAVGKSDLGLVIVSAVMLFATNICDQTAIKLTPNPGYHSAVRAMSIMIITIGSSVIFDCSITLKSFFGIIFMLIGIILVVGG